MGPRFRGDDSLEVFDKFEAIDLRAKQTKGLTMTITGHQLIGGRDVRGSEAGFYAVNPATGQQIPQEFTGAGKAEVELACALAAQAFTSYRHTSLNDRADFLERIAQTIVALGDELIEAAMRESGLPRARLEGERGRTVNQLNLFATLVRSGE